MKWLLFLFVVSTPVGAQPNALLLVAKPDLVDPNFRESVVLVTQTGDGSEVTVALFRAERTPEASAFAVLKGVYLTMHPQNIEPLLAQRGGNYRLYSGFSGWSAGQLESELRRDGWYLLPASAALVFRKDTAGMWQELVRKARARVALR
jgi:putative AlgH/UPF0301 family transcriptional regulator